jgi:hypothetical protein
MMLPMLGCRRLRSEASADDYAAAYVRLYTQAIGEAVAPDSSQAAATAAWVEEFLPSAAPRAWLGVASETGLSFGCGFRPPQGRAVARIAAVGAVFNPLAAGALAALIEDQAQAGLIASNATWHDTAPEEDCSHGLDAGDRQQELFVVVDAAMACIESLRHRLR